MPKRLDIGVIVGDKCNKDEILNLLHTICNSGYFIIGARLENELKYINGDGFSEIEKTHEPNETTIQIRLKNEKTGRYFFKILTQKELEKITDILGEVKWS